MMPGISNPEPEAAFQSEFGDETDLAGMGAERLAALNCDTRIVQDGREAFDRRTFNFGERRFQGRSARAPESGKIPEYKGRHQRHLDLARLIMPSNDPMAENEQAHKKGHRHYVHHISPTPAAWQ